MAPLLVRFVLTLLRWPIQAAFWLALRFGLGLWPTYALGRATEVRPLVLHGTLGPFLTRFFLSPKDRSPYMMRICITPFHGGGWLGRAWTWCRLPEVFVHYFFRSDEDRELHNHPFSWAVSLILQGGYLEERQDYSIPWRLPNELRPGDTNTIWESTFHRVTLLDEISGCWSLFVGGPRVAGENWGFLQDDGSIVPHREYQARSVRAVLPLSAEDAAFLERQIGAVYERTLRLDLSDAFPRRSGCALVCRGGSECRRCSCKCPAECPWGMNPTQAERDAAR